MYHRKSGRYNKKAHASKATKKYVQSAIRKQVETKFYGVTNITAVSTVEYTNGVFVQLSGGIASGTTNTQRIGSSIRPQGLKLDFNATLGSVPTACQGRIIIFQDKENHSVDPVLTDIVGAGGSTVTVSGYNPGSVPVRYKIIKDLKFVLDTVDKTQWRRTVYIKRKSLNMVHWENVATFGKGQIYVVFMSNLIGTANTTPIISYGSRLSFDDA